MPVFKVSLSYLALGLACVWSARLQAQEVVSPCDSVCRAWIELTTAPETPQATSRSKRRIFEASSKPPGPSVKSKQVTSRRSDEYLRSLRDEASVRADRASRSQDSVPSTPPPKTDRPEISDRSADRSTTSSIGPQPPLEGIPRNPSPVPLESTKDVTANTAFSAPNAQGGPNTRAGSLERGSTSEPPVNPPDQASSSTDASSTATAATGYRPSVRPKLQLPGFPPPEENKAPNEAGDKSNPASLAAASDSQFYIVQNVATKRCSVVDTKTARNNTTTSIILTGIVYTSRAEAEVGMKMLRECSSS
jgi:hypothetical protein